MLQSRFFSPWCSGSFFGRSDSLMTPLSAVWISSYLMQLCLRFCFWILQSQISTVCGNLYCSASLSHWSVSEFPQDFPIFWNREISRANLSRLLTGAALRSLELQLSRIFTETQEWHRLWSSAVCRFIILWRWLYCHFSSRDKKARIKHWSRRHWSVSLRIQSSSVL